MIGILRSAGLITRFTSSLDRSRESFLKPRLWSIKVTEILNSSCTPSLKAIGSSAVILEAVWLRMLARTWAVNWLCRSLLL